MGIIVDTIEIDKNSVNSTLLTEKELKEIVREIQRRPIVSEKLQYLLNFFYDKKLRFISNASDISLNQLFISGGAAILVFEEMQQQRV